VVSWLQRLLARRHTAPLPTITADCTGFSLTVHHRTRAVAWAAIRRIAAYKRGLNDRGEVVLLIELSGPKQAPISLTDSFPGFSDLFLPMEQALGINPEAYLAIMAPAAEPTPTVVYLKP